MRLITAPMWRSWVAALCVALVAFVALEQGSAAHASEPCNAISVASAETRVDISIEVAQEETGAPDDSQQQAQRHNCCGAHTSNAPPQQHASVPVQLAQVMALVRTDDAALDRAPLGLERPPKTTAIA